MLLTLSHSSAESDATALGFLLHKHPARPQTFEVASGVAHVFYPEATPARTTVALLLELDAIALARSKRFTGDSFALAHYVNDRPYSSGSMMAVALGKVFRTAMTGRSDSHPDLAAAPLDLAVTIAAVPARGGADLVRALFAPLGWTVDVTAVPLDPQRPEWGESRYVDLRLHGRVRLTDALRHLYVLLPVLDDAKHYWVNDDEVGKLLRAGEGWLADHPERELVTERYLRHQRGMVADAAARLTASEGDGTVQAAAESGPPPRRLADARADAVITALHDVGARRVADLGCGEGALLARLVADPAFTDVIGTDVSARALAAADRRLDLRRAPDRVREQVRLLQSSVTYEDDRLNGLDAVVLMEVVEHVDLERLPAVEHAVWGAARPGAVVVTTPNAEYNRFYDRLEPNGFRHPDHRFEHTRAEFEAWAERVAASHGYAVEFRPVGDADPDSGAPTQLALFRRRSA